MRTGIVGLGLRAGNVLKMMQADMPELELVGFVDPDPCGLPLLEGITSQLQQYENVETMIAKCNLDLLWVASPNHLHLGHIRAGLEAGLKVFTEKPIVITKSESFSLAKLIHKYGENQLMVGLVLRYSQHMRELRRVIDAGMLGRITSIEANEHIAPYHGSFFMRDWRRLEKYSGGFMLEKCCHDLDIYNNVVVTGRLELQVLVGEVILSLRNLRAISTMTFISKNYHTGKVLMIHLPVTLILLTIKMHY